MPSTSSVGAGLTHAPGKYWLKRWQIASWHRHALCPLSSCPLSGQAQAGLCKVPHTLQCCVKVPTICRHFPDLPHLGLCAAVLGPPPAKSWGVGAREQAGASVRLLDPEAEAERAWVGPRATMAAGLQALLPQRWWQEMLFLWQLCLWQGVLLIWAPELYLLLSLLVCLQRTSCVGHQQTLNWLSRLSQNGDWPWAVGDLSSTAISSTMVSPFCTTWQVLWEHGTRVQQPEGTQKAGQTQGLKPGHLTFVRFLETVCSGHLWQLSQCWTCLVEVSGLDVLLECLLGITCYETETITHRHIWFIFLSPNFKHPFLP